MERHAAARQMRRSRVGCIRVQMCRDGRQTDVRHARCSLHAEGWAMRICGSVRHGETKMGMPSGQIPATGRSSPPLPTASLRAYDRSHAPTEPSWPLRWIYRPLAAGPAREEGAQQLPCRQPCARLGARAIRRSSVRIGAPPLRFLSLLLFACVSSIRPQWRLALPCLPLLAFPGDGEPPQGRHCRASRRTATPLWRSPLGPAARPAPLFCVCGALKCRRPRRGASSLLRRLRQRASRGARKDRGER
jgi:hypothetical protein